MTTTDFLEIYAAARADYLNEDANRPMDPVIRLHRDDDGRYQWIYESGLLPVSDGFLAEVRLDDFHQYWYEGYIDDEHIPTETDITEFTNQLLLGAEQEED